MSANKLYWDEGEENFSLCDECAEEYFMNNEDDMIHYFLCETNDPCIDCDK